MEVGLVRQNYLLSCVTADWINYQISYGGAEDEFIGIS